MKNEGHMLDTRPVGLAQTFTGPFSLVGKDEPDGCGGAAEAVRRSNCLGKLKWKGPL